jgi:hypothetical protein
MDNLLAIVFEYTNLRSAKTVSFPH